MDYISFGYILCLYCISSLKPLLDFLIFAHTCIKYQNCNWYVEKEIWKDFPIRMETWYNQPIQSSGIAQNNQMICINVSLTPPGNSLLFDLNWKGLEIIWSPTIWIKTGKKKEIGANYEGHWIEGVERKF